MNKNITKINIEEQRVKFPALENKKYFNFGGQGTLATSSLNAIIKTHQYIQEEGPFSLKVNAWLKEKIPLLRKAIAEELKTKEERITLTENVTAGCNIALWGIEWQEGDRILISDCEHPGIIATVNEISRRFKVIVDRCSILKTLNEGDCIAEIEKEINPKTRLLVISHLLWNTGQVLPIKKIVELCHNNLDRPIQVLVDAAQSVGSLNLDLPDSGVDYYAFTGHKWLCGPSGVGGLYISESAFSKLHPTFIGWRSVETDIQDKPIGWKNTGEKFEVATSAYPEYEGLITAIKVHQEWGTAEERYKQIVDLSNYLWSQLQKLDNLTCLKNSPPEAGLVSFKINTKENHDSIVKALEREKIILRTIADPDCIRACVHYLTLPTEIDALVEAIEQYK